MSATRKRVIDRDDMSELTLHGENERLVELVRELRESVDTLIADVTHLTKTPDNMPGFRMAVKILEKSEGV